MHIYIYILPQEIILEVVRVRAVEILIYPEKYSQKSVLIMLHIKLGTELTLRIFTWFVKKMARHTKTRWKFSKLSSLLTNFQKSARHRIDHRKSL